MNPPHRATVFAPASVGNAAAGFDLLGHAIDGPGDTVTATRHDRPGVAIESITGCDYELPFEAPANTAGRAVLELLDQLRPGFGIRLDIQKGIPLGSGLGGSAASATAAVVAANALLPEPLDRAALYPFALAGEAVASGAAHGDNVAPQLLGGLVLATPERLLALPVPDNLHAVVVHPDHVIETRRARESLREPFPIETIVAQQARLALLLCGLFRNDPELVAAGLEDVLVEPRRSGRIPGFARVRQAALDHGALGASISGAGPSIFGWFDGNRATRQAGDAMVAVFAEHGLAATAWSSPVDAPGARVLESPQGSP